MTGPRPPESSGRPQDTPRFPTYGRPEDDTVPQHQSPGTTYQSPASPYPTSATSDPAAPYPSPATPDPASPYPSPMTQYQSQGSPYSAPGGPPPVAPYPGQGWPQQAPYQATTYQGAPQQGTPYQGAAGQWREPLPAYPTPYGGQGYGYPGLMPVRTNGLAIAAMVTGLSSILVGVTAPVAVVLGIVALVQLRKSGDKGTAQAVVGLVVGALMTLLWGAIFAVALLVEEDSGAFGDSDLPAPTGSSVSVDELAVGECFDETDDEVMVNRMSCADPHDGEFFASVDLPAGAFPGDDESADRSEVACDKVFATYVGISIDDSELNMASWSPDGEAWEDGDRRALCAVYGPGDDKVTGTLKGSRR